MRRKALLLVAAIVIMVSSFTLNTGIVPVEANTGLRDRIKSIQDEQQDNQQELDKKKSEIKAIEGEKKQVETEMREIDVKASETTQKIRSKESEVEATLERIEATKEEIVVTEARIEERDRLLKERVRSMYKNGGTVNYLEVILGARSFGDLINRINALGTIAQQDRNIIEAHQNDKQTLEEAEDSLENDLEALEDQLEELEGLKATLDKQRVEKDRLLSKLEEQEGELLDQFVELEEANEILAAQERAMKIELEAWQERQRQLEEERKRQEELAAQRAREEAERAARGETVEQPSRSGETHPAPPQNTDTQFMRPATGNITSPFGWRVLMGNRQFHYGIDIGKGGRVGDVPVVAAYEGTVVRSYYSPSYGNTVILSHNVNGQVITTLYAHLENRLVNDGQRVSKGQLLGNMGNTGRSFGAHLHFEVHEGVWNASKSNAVDPLNYIPR